MAKDLATQIQQDEKLDVSYERVEKYNAPLLVIGLGGTGADAVRTVKQTLAQRFKLPVTQDGKVIPVPRRTGYLVIDSDATGKDGLDENEIVNIADGVNLAALLKDKTHKDLSDKQKRWVHRKLHEVGPDGGTGAGTYRAASRLMLDLNFNEVYNRIHSALTKLVTMEAGGQAMSGAAQIFVVTGIGGGTGSGTFLDVGQIIRHMMKTEPDLLGSAYNLSCYIVMPDLTISHVLEDGATAMIPIIERNSYAALKELDFWMDYGRHHTHYEMEYNCGKKIIWAQPYDHVTLMSGTNVAGKVFSGSYKLVQRTIAENLLHYMADEAPDKSGGGTAQFSFLSYESNLKAQADTCREEVVLPLNHTYRAVGAYSKRIPKKKILFYEGMLLYKTFMPPRNEHGVLVPNDKLLHDGKATQRFGDVAMKNFKQLYLDYAKAVPFPKMFQDFNAKNKTLVDGLRKLNPPSHQKFGQWQQNSVAPVAREYAENYRKSVWQNFAKLCKTIMSDPELGPYSLLQYLKEESVSLRTAFRNYAASAQSQCNNLYGSIGAAQQICVNSYSDFLKPPLLAGDKAVQTYLTALRDLLDTVRQYELSRQYAHVMELIAKSIDSYITNALEPLCALLEELEADFVRPDNVVDSLGSDLFDVATLHANIQATFADANKDGAVSRAFLGKLCDSTFDTVPNVDTGSCGLTFLFKHDCNLKALQLMKEEMDTCFKVINSQSLESIMQLQCYDDNVAVEAANQQAYISNLANSVVESATPLYSLIKNSTGIVDHTAKCLYFSVPQDAHTFLNQLAPGGKPVTIQGVPLTPKASALTDHIYCNMTWDVLPLYSYSLMDNLKKSYDATLNNPENPAANAIHLVWNGDADSDYRQNWCRLPSPSPYYLFGTETISQSEKNEYEAVRKLVMRAIDCGMLTINSTVENPVMHPEYTFRVFRNAHSALHNEVIQQNLAQVLARKNPVTGAPLDPATMVAALNTLIGEAEPIKHAASKSPIVMNRKVGINEDLHPINPFSVQDNPVLLREAKKNYHTLTVEYAVHVLLQNPSLLTDVEYQIDSFEKIGAEINRLEGSARVWEPRIAYAETFAKLVAYDLVAFDMMGNPIYTDESGAVSPLIQPAILKEDLKDCQQVVKAVAVASDLTGEHAIRQSLEFKLSGAENAWNEAALHSELTAEAISAQIKRLEALLTEATAEHKACVAEKQNNIKANHALQDKYIALLDGVENYAKNRLTALKRINIGPVPAPVQPADPAPADTWDCACGKTGLKGKFCPDCGAKKPQPEPVPAKDTWTCPTCGKTGLKGKFCPDCGTKKPEVQASDTWTCPACGKAGLKGKFCPECGEKKPGAAPVKLTWICTECGTRDITGKFCPECGASRPNA